MLGALLALLAAAAQLALSEGRTARVEGAAPPQEGPVTTGGDRSSAVRIQLSGRIDTHYAYRSGSLNETADLLNGASPAGTSSSDFWSGRASLRADITLKEKATGVLELETRSFDEGQNIPKALEDEAGEVHVEQAYLEFPGFVASKLLVRVGVQDISFRNRPQGEPFFMELGESEGLFSGLGASGEFVRTTADRDVREAVGARARYDFFEVLSAHAFWVVYGEPPGGGPSGDDESVAALVLNGKTGDDFAAWLLGALVSGDGEGVRIGTLGLGFDGYPFASRGIELFGEFYHQRGTLADDIRHVSKRAWAGEAGARWVCGKWAAEASYAHRTGDPHPTDGRDGAFQSYENVNRFLILENAEFGLDIDTNHRSPRGAVEAGPFDLGEPVRHLRLRLDVGHFRLDDPARDSGGRVLVSSGDDDLGVEIDATVRWAYTDSVLIWIRAAGLFGSDAIEALTGGDDAAAAVLGADLRF